MADDRQLLRTVRYIHRNALDVGGVSRVEDYRWSSHRTYLGYRRCPEWLRTDTVLAHFGGDRDEFARFVDDITPGRIAARPHGVTPTTLSSAAEMVAAEFESRLTRSLQGLSRTLIVLLDDRSDDPDIRAAARAFLGASADGVALPVVRRARRQAAAEPVLLEMTERIRRLVA